MSGHPPTPPVRPRDQWRDPAFRRSRVDPDGGGRLLFADLHNHSVLSDGRGDPEQAFEQMRGAGLDVAALTDHASIPASLVPSLGLHQYPDREALALASSPPRSIDAAAWQRADALADAYDAPGEFCALRGFEWTEPWLGHVNVWFSRTFQPVTTPGTLDGLHRWLLDDEPAALFGYNHPGREPGLLGGFEPVLPGTPAAELTGRMVALEAFNRYDDFLLAGAGAGGFPGWGSPGPSATGLQWSPLAAALDAGWRAGLIGCSDEHGTTYALAGKGRTGLWAPVHDREGVRQALLARSVYATREVGLRLDATLDGARMGSDLPAPDGAQHLEVDLAWPGHEGRPVELQLIRSDGEGHVDTHARIAAHVGDLVARDVDACDGAGWVMLRVADPALPSGMRAPAGHAGAVRGLAYASPWWFA